MKRKSEKKKTSVDTTNMTKTALCAALLGVSSYLVLPLPFTPIVLSMHTVVVNVIGLIQKPRDAAYTVLIYLCMGLIGMPVFSGGTAGPSKLFGPTGGFYFGFLFAVLAIGRLKGRKINVPRYVLVTMMVGIPIQHFFAILLMCMHNGFHIRAAAMTVSVPFLPGDILKCVIASVIGAALNRAL